MAASVFLKPLTPDARAAVGGAPLEITRFPFRVGRDSRSGPRGTGGVVHPSRRADSFPSNDLYLREAGTVFNVSREHFLIDLRDGAYVLVDRGSSCGTLVEGDLVGDRKQGGVRRLNDQDVIIVGTSESKFVFKFIVFNAS